MMGRRVLREQHDLEYGRVPDLIAIGLLTGTVSLVALGLTQGPNWGWGDTRVISSFAGATVLVAALSWRSRRQPWTTSNLSLRIPSVRFANVAILIFACAFYAKILTDVLFLTSIWHYTVLAAGAAITPGPLITAALAGPAGRLADRYGLVPIAGIGAVIYTAGCAWYAVRAGTHADYVIRWLPGTAFTGIGIAMAFPTLTTAAVQGLPARLYATGSGLNATARQLGGVLGVAIVIAILGQAGTSGHSAFVNAWTFAAIAAGISAAAVLVLGHAARTQTSEALLGAIPDRLAHGSLKPLLNEAIELSPRLPHVVHHQMAVRLMRAVGDQPVGPVAGKVERLADRVVVVKGECREAQAQSNGHLPPPRVRVVTARPYQCRSGRPPFVVRMRAAKGAAHDHRRSDP
ncbi:MAG: MFS transporter [Actinobacteria bacterium]|nr:MAG: MFS transporter [Actinomycetota bacterium]